MVSSLRDGALLFTVSDVALVFEAHSDHLVSNSRHSSRPARIKEVVTEAGFTHFRSVAETPFHRVLEVRA